ncbi:MAG: hypothetical protein KatS3mg053_1201 [Candidatus Roseilinea sp.]|nr:MAG: hypothetical protein KatS3mg053_1201 [Candidatus Roseilinea sp.]
MNDAQKTVAGALLIGGSLLTGNTALITVAGGVGVNWTSEGLQGLRRQWRTRKLDTPLARAYSAAILAAVEWLRSEYVKTRDSQSPTSAFDLVAACAGGIANAEFPAGQLSADAAQAQLDRGLDDLLHGHDARQAEFLKARLMPATAIALRDALAADPEAWMRFHGWLIEDLRAGQAEMSGKLSRAAEVLACFADPSVALQALRDSLGEIGAATGRIDARTERIERKQDALHDDVKRLLDKPDKPTTSGPIFNNQGMQVGGAVHQAGQINITNAGGGPAGASQSAGASSSAALDKPALRDWLVRHFSRADLELLCADVQAQLARQGYAEPVSLEIVGGDGLAQQCQRLIEYLDRRGHLDVLVRVARSKRPGAPFSDG